MENYYDILEVSEKASGEVIEKAYKVLAKKYHPDLQEPQNKSKAEEMMKKINEAYDVLIDPEKRAEYDAKLNAQKANQSNQSNHSENYEKQAQNINYYGAQQAYDEEYKRRLNEQLNKEAYERQIRNREYELKYRQQMQNKMNQEYENAYYNYLKSLGYKVKEKWTWKKTLLLLEVLGILALVIVVLWFFPPTNKLLVAFYEGNPIIKWIVDVIVKLVEAIFTSIYKVFTNPPQLNA